jgi:hypothetical protein
MSSSTTSVDPSTTSDAGNSGGTPAGTSALYLYTFLATLLLLLGISAAIVCRSIIVRRRTRRLIEEAIANGTWIPPAVRVPVNLAEKPLLYDVYTELDPEQEGEMQEKAAMWNDILPVSPTLVRKNPKLINQLSIQEPATRQTRIQKFLRWRTNEHRSRGGSSSSGSGEPQITSPGDLPEYKAVSVSVMIAMPLPPDLNTRHGGEDECPVVEFGIADVELPQGWTIETGL